MDNCQIAIWIRENQQEVVSRKANIQRLTERILQVIWGRSPRVCSVVSRSARSAFGATRRGVVTYARKRVITLPGRLRALFSSVQSDALASDSQCNDLHPKSVCLRNALAIFSRYRRAPLRHFRPLIIQYWASRGWWSSPIRV